MSEDSIVTFEKAKREGSHILASLEATSGRGKTFSGLLLGRGLVGPEGKLAILDTEMGRGRTFAKSVPGGYDYGALTPPYTPERFIAGIKAAEAAGIECLVIDSGSLEWEGIGGIGEIAEASTSASGRALSGLAKWAKPKARHKRFVQTLLTTNMHIIVCLRAKEKLVQRKGADGKDEIVSIGWVPVQEKYFPYDMTIRLFFPEGNRPGVPEIMKCPGDLLGAFESGAQVSVETGARIAEWVHDGEPVNPEFVALKRDAEEAAEGGGAVLDAFLKRLTKTQKEALRPFGANLRSIADTADKDAADAQEPDSGIPSFRPEAA